VEIPISIVQFDSTTDDLKTKLRQAQSLGFNNGNGMVWMHKGKFDAYTEPVEKAVSYFINILAQGKSIHPFLESPGFPQRFSSVAYFLLLNFTKHGMQNFRSWEEIMNAYDNHEGADHSYFLAFDVGTLEQFSYPYTKYYNAHFVMLRQHGFNFITCSGVHLKNEINAFLRPFDWITWTCVSVTITIIAAFTSQSNRLNSFIDTFGALIEQSNTAFIRNLRKKLYSLPVLLIFLTISGAYKGKILQFLVLPRQYELTVTRIYEMTNFTFYSTKELYFFNNTYDAYFLDLLSDIGIGIDMSEFQEVYIAYLKTRENFNEAMLNKVKKMLYLPHRPDSFNYREQRGYYFVKHCNQTSYAGFLDTIDDNLRKANEMGQEDNVVFMKGSDNFRPTIANLSFLIHTWMESWHTDCKGS